MSKEVKYSRFLLKRTNISGLSATTALNDDHTSIPAWKTTDIYVGELYLNSIDEKLWIRTRSNIREIPLFDGTSSLNSFPDVLISNPTDGQVLTFSGGRWINKNPEFEGTGITYSTVLPPPMTIDSMTRSSMGSDSIKETTIIKNVEKISNIKDTSFNELKDFDLLVYKDKKWINFNLKDISTKDLSLNDIKNIDISEPIDNQSLIFEDGKWKNKKVDNYIEDVILDKEEYKLMIDTNEGSYELSLNGRPISIINDDIALDETFSTIIVDASVNDINIHLPQSKHSYGLVFTFKFINLLKHTIKILPTPDEFIFINSPLTECVIRDKTSQNLKIQCDGDSIWYSII